MTRDQRRDVIWAPLAIWAGLMALLAMTIVYAYLPALPAKTGVALAIGAAKALLIAVFFMQLRAAAGLVRLAAATGCVWLSLLWIFTFADYLTRAATN
jgi:cytochrome c oxidase subunit 4